MSAQIIFDFLKNHSISYTLFEHQPVYTTEDKPIVTAINGTATTGTIPHPHSKTLFLKVTKNGTFYLVSVFEDKRIDLKKLSDSLNCGRFSFGKKEELLELLHLTPGAVTPFGLLFDKEKKVHFILDKDALEYATVCFHPMRNDMTITLTPQDFLRCIEIMGHHTKIMPIPEK